MLSDPLVLTHPDGAISCARVNQDNYSSEYKLVSASKETRVRIRHVKTTGSVSNPPKDRHNVEIQETVYATASVPEFTRKAYVVIEVKPGDLTPAWKLVDTLAEWLRAGAGTNVFSLLAWAS